MRANRKRSQDSSSEQERSLITVFLHESDFKQQFLGVLAQACDFDQHRQWVKWLNILKDPIYVLLWIYTLPGARQHRQELSAASSRTQDPKVTLFWCYFVPWQVVHKAVQPQLLCCQRSFILPCPKNETLPPFSNMFDTALWGGLVATALLPPVLTLWANINVFEMPRWSPGISWSTSQ